MILGLIGPKGVGKSTLARLLSVDLGFRRLAFADPLKAMIRALLRSQNCSSTYIDRILNGDMKELPSPYFSGKTSRYVMQTLGTEWGRLMIDEYFWVNVLKTTIKTLQHEQISNFVIDDMRFKSEAKALKELNAKLILIEREGHLPGPHLSEREYLEIKPDITITNNDDPSHMMEQLKAANFPNL